MSRKSRLGTIRLKISADVRLEVVRFRELKDFIVTECETLKLEDKETSLL